MAEVTCDGGTKRRRIVGRVQFAAVVCLSLNLLASCTGRDASIGVTAWWPGAVGSNSTEVRPPRRLNNVSPWFTVREADLDLQASWCGWDERTGRRVAHLNIHRKAKQMIEEADRLIVASVFLFDNLYFGDPPERDIVEEFTQLLIEKKQHNPGMSIVVTLDLMHKLWADRSSPAVEALTRNGIDVFYSDLLDSQPANRIPIYHGLAQLMRRLNAATGGLSGHSADAIGSIPLPGVRMDNDAVRISTLTSAFQLKANHRKVLVTARGDRFEALVTSANPHNPSLPNENYAISVLGPVARHTYMVLREDVRHALALGGRFVDEGTFSGEPPADYLKTVLPAVIVPRPMSPPPPGVNDESTQPRVALVTEQAIEEGVLAMLRGVTEHDQVRIQMFYLSSLPVINAILDSAARTRQPVRILLDPNRVGFGMAKNGTPNSQVAAYLMKRAKIESANLQIRWYATHGEQNHAKIMSVSDPENGKYELTTGSANFTRKNLEGINLEANLFVVGSAKLNRRFDAQFDRLWYNSDPNVLYSVSWDDPRHNYHHHKGRRKWATPQRFLFVVPMRSAKGRPLLREQEFVHW
ncbi:MAG: phospholipase D-like domain-containing protein [Phycisphaerae bacterium]|nr:phospholipase D-like domain-containing protein [Phycisphaerae bacterium]